MVISLGLLIIGGIVLFAVLKGNQSAGGFSSGFSDILSRFRLDKREFTAVDSEAITPGTQYNPTIRGYGPGGEPIYSTQATDDPIHHTETQTITNPETGLSGTLQLR